MNRKMEILPLHLIISVVFYAGVFQVSNGCYSVPSRLQCTHLNVASPANGATCTSSPADGGNDCYKAIDGIADIEGSDSEYIAAASGGYFIKIEFAGYFLINRLRVMQLRGGATQISDLSVEFSDSTSHPKSLTPNIAGDKAMEEITLKSRNVSWVKLVVQTTVPPSESRHGFKEIEVYNDVCMKDLQCDMVTLQPSNETDPIPLMAETVMFSMKSVNPLGLRLITSPTSNVGYFLLIGTGVNAETTLSRVQASDTPLKTESTSNILDGSWRTFWLDYRGTGVTLGSGATCLLHFDDTADHQKINFIKFGTSASSEIIFLCNRQDQCYNDASYYWPLDKAIGGDVLDVIGGNIGKGSGLTTTSNFINGSWVSGPMWNSVTSVALSFSSAGPVTLGDLSSSCFVNLDLCTDGLTVAFWFKLADDDILSFLYSKESFTIISITAESSEFMAYIRSSSNDWSVNFNVTFDSWHHVAITWSETAGLLAVVDFVRTVKGDLGGGDPSSGNEANFTTIGAGNSSMHMSQLVVYERFMSVSEIQKLAKCTGLVPDKVPESFSVGSGIVPNDAFDASSSFDEYSGPSRGRALLEEEGLLAGGWRPKDQSTSQYLQIDLLQVRNITAIMTQGGDQVGCACEEWVREYTLSHSLCGAFWSYYWANGSVMHFVGNHDGETLVSYSLCPALTARILRFHPMVWTNAIAMRVDVVASKNAENYMGCFLSPNDMALHSDFSTADLTPETCVTSCGLDGKLYAGLANGSECHCSDTSPDPLNEVGDDLCYYPCRGNKALMCGSELYFSVYIAKGQFDFPFTLSVSDTTPLPFTIVNINVTVYEGAEVVLNLGDGTVIRTMNSSHDYLFTSLGALEIYADTIVGYYGEPQTASATKTINIKYTVTGLVTIECPRVVEAWTDFKCMLTVAQGSDLFVKLHGPSGEIVNGTMEDTSSEMVGSRTPFSSSQSQMNMSDGDEKTVILPNYYFAKSGILRAFKINVSFSGYLKLQVLRPLCTLHPSKLYCFVGGTCTFKVPLCSLENLSFNCPSAGAICNDSLDCLAALLVCPDGTVYNATLSPEYEVVYSSMLYVPKGFHIIVVNQSASSGVLDVRKGDILAIGLVNSSGAEIISENSGGNAFVLSTGNLEVGDTIQTEGNLDLEQIQHRFDISAVYTPWSELAILLNYPVGRWTQSGTVGDKDITFTVVACVSIKNITWIFPEFAPTNKTFNVNVPAHAGHNVTYELRIENSNNYTKSDFKFFYTWANISKAFPLIFAKEGMQKVIFTASNLLSSSMKKCQIYILDPIEDLYLFNITPQALGNKSEINWSITKGTNVSYSISFGDGSVLNGSFLSLGILVASSLHLYPDEGPFNVTLTASNLVSNKTVSGNAHVIAPVANLSCRVIHAARDIEVNETIKLNATYSQGTNVEVRVDFGDGQSANSSSAWKICEDACFIKYSQRFLHSYITWGNYSTNLTFSNLVSSESCFPFVFVHKPVYNLTGFNVTCPPANLTTPTVCMLTITGGNDFWCDWKFGSPYQVGQSHFWNLTLPVENTYPNVGNFSVTLNCRNRLYETTAAAQAIVQEPITGLDVVYPEAQSVDADFDLSIDVTTGSSMEFEITLQRIFAEHFTMQTSVDTDRQSQISIPVSRAAFPIAGVYRLTVKAKNLVTPLQVVTGEIKVDKPISNLRLLNNDTFIPVNATTNTRALVDTGTNVTLDWDFKDGDTSSSMFPGDLLRYSGDYRAHTYTDHGAYLLNITASNPVSTETVLKYIYVQYVVKNIILTSDSPQEIPPGTVTFTVSVRSDTHPPTNASIDMDFGDGQIARNTLLGGQQVIKIYNSYSTPGVIRVNLTMRNDISSEQLEGWVDVQRSIKNLGISAHHTGGDAGYGAPGRGPQQDSFPAEYAVLFFANTTDGTAVTYTWDFGDGTPTVVTNSTSVVHSFATPHYFTVSLDARNSISRMTVNRTIRMMQSILNVTFENDSPTVHEDNTSFVVTVGQQGTESCFLIDLGNLTRFLYRGFSDVVCDNELVTMATEDITVLPSLNFTFNFQYWQMLNYRVKIVALNTVSRITIYGWAIILSLPCDFPIVRIPDGGRSYHTRTKYFRADYITIKSRCTINCLASRFTRFEWELNRITAATDNGTTDSTEGFEKSLPVLVIPQRTMPYGMYRLRLNVSMVGLPLVSRHRVAFMEIMPSPLVAEIIGGNSWLQSLTKSVILDASLSHDPDFGPNDKRGLKYFWYCKTSDEDYDFPTVPEGNSSSESNSSYDSGCFRNGTRRLHVHTEVSEIEPRLMWINKTYIFKFFIVKESRMASFVVRVYLTLEDPPVMVIRKPHGLWPGNLNPSTKFSIQGTCRNCSLERLNSMTISWSLRVFEDKSANETTPKDQVLEQRLYTIQDWALVPDLSSMTRAGIHTEYFIMRANSLKSGTSYAARIEGRFGDGATGRAELIIKTTVPPSGGQCYVIKKEGHFLDALNTLVCEGWTSNTGSTDLIYVYFYKTSPDGPEYMVQYITDPVIRGIRLPLGLKEHNHTLFMKAVISDKFGSKTETTFEYKSPQNEEDDLDTLSMLLREIAMNGTLRTLEMEGYSQFTNQYVSSVSSLLNAMSSRASNLTNFKWISRTIRARMCQTLSGIQMDEIKTVRETAHALATVAAIPDECNMRAQFLINTTLNEMVTFITKQTPIADPTELWDTLHAISEALGNAIGVVTHDLGLIFLGNGTNSTRNETYMETGISLTENFLEYTRILSGAYLIHTLPKEEAIQVRSSSLYFTLNRDYPAGFSSRSLHCGLEKVILPDNFGGLLMEGSHSAFIVIDALVISSPFLPFIWTVTANKVNSQVLIIEIRDEHLRQELEVANLSEPIDLRIRKNDVPLNASTGEVEYTKTLQHRFNVFDNRSSINIEIRVLGEFEEQPMLAVYLRKGEPPTMDGDERDKVRVVPQLYRRYLEDGGRSNNTTAEQEFSDPNVLFYSNSELNETAAGEYYVIIEFNGTVSGADVPEANRTIEYTFSAYTSDCLYWEELTETWIGAGCVVGPLSNSTHTQCLCTHLSSFASGFLVPPNKIDWSKVSLAELLNNPTVTIIVCCCFLLYFLLLIWARRRDKKDLELIGVTPLPSNDPRDLYGYEIVIFTGHDRSAGTTADVSIVLTGRLEQTQTRHLRDLHPARKKFRSGNVDYFLLTVPRTLGKIQRIQIWHNNAGANPSWFLSRVLIRDLQTDKTMWFVCDKWLAVEEDDGRIDRTLHSASKKDLVKFNFLFSTEVRKNLSDGHLWYSVMHRPLRSTFTRVQRLSCCLSILMTSMIANAMFYQDGEGGDASGVEVQIGPIRLSIKQISIGVMSSLVVLPVNLIVVNIFRKARPKNSEMLAQDPNKRDFKYQGFDEDSEEDESAKEETEELDEKAKKKKEKEKEKEKKKKEKKEFTIPHFTIYIAYVLIFLASTTSAAFTCFYSLTYGKEKSERWVSSMMISFWQDVIISQPIKVIIMAVLFALIVKDPDKANEDEGKQTVELGKDEEWVHDRNSEHLNQFDFRKVCEVSKPPGEEQLHVARQLRTKEKQMHAIMREMMLYSVFLIVLLVVAYGSRDTRAYGVTEAISYSFVDSRYTSLLPFDSVGTTVQYWNWVENTLIPTLKPQYWYGPYIDPEEEDLWSAENVARRGRHGRRKLTKTKGGGSYVDHYIEEDLTGFPKGFTADRGLFYIVGTARMRQLRVKKDSCTIPKYWENLIHDCNTFYSWEAEEEGAFLPGWQRINNTDDTKAPDEQQSPWVWQSAMDLRGTPFWGIFASYWGGGFVLSLKPARLTSLAQIRDLELDGWIDQQTRALFAEFTVYNAHTNFFCVVTMLAELLPTGGYHQYEKIHTLRLYRYTGLEQMVLMAFELTLFLFLCIFLYSELKQVFIFGKAYFKDPWNYIESLIIGLCFTAIMLYLAGLGFTNVAVTRMREHPETFVSFDYIVLLDEAYNGALGFAVSCAFLKFLKLLRFNRRMSMLVQTVKVSSKPLISFFFMFLIFFMAYAQMAFLVFGNNNQDYASFVATMQTMLSMTLGGFDFIGLQDGNRLLGPIFFFSYMVFIFLILVNVFVSIVNDSFAEVSSDVEKQTNDHEIVDYVLHLLKEQIGKHLGSPFKPLYKPTLTVYEKALVDIEDRADNIQYVIDDIYLEEQRQTNWFKVEKLTEKKTELIRFLLHLEEHFDEDDLSYSIPLMANFMKEHSKEELQDLYESHRERDFVRRFHGSRSISSDEEQYDQLDRETVYENSWMDYEQPLYGDADCGDEAPKPACSLDSIKEEIEPSDTESIFSSTADHNLQEECHETTSCSSDEKSTKPEDIYVDIIDEPVSVNSVQLSLEDYQSSL